jgi:hypothetical protein
MKGSSMSRLTPTASLLLLLGLGACTLPSMASLGLPTEQTATLPEDAYFGAGDPLRSAINNTTVAFSAPSQLAGKPAQAARAVAEMEYLNVEISTNPRSYGGSVTASTVFPGAQREWRAALGISPSAPPQAVIDSMFAAARALQSGQPRSAEVVFSQPIFTLGGPATLARLASLPNLPVTNTAAQEASRVLRRGGVGRL